MAAAANREANSKQKSQYSKNLRDEYDDVISRKGKSAVKEIVSREMATIVKQALDDALH